MCKNTEYIIILHLHVFEINSEEKHRECKLKLRINAVSLTGAVSTRLKGFEFCSLSLEVSLSLVQRRERECGIVYFHWSHLPAQNHFSNRDLVYCIYRGTVIVRYAAITKMEGLFYSFSCLKIYHEIGNEHEQLHAVYQIK